MQLVSTFADMYFKGVSATTESICYLGPHAWYIKENEIKQTRQDKTEERKNNKDKYRHSMQSIYTANN